jgi:hypothetical protein
LADGIAGNFDMTLKTIGVLANAEGLNGTHIRLGAKPTRPPVASANN